MRKFLSLLSWHAFFLRFPLHWAFVERNIFVWTCKMLPFLLTLNYQECNVRFVCFAWHHESGFLVLTTDLQGRHVFTWAKCKNCGGQSYKILCKRNVLPPAPFFQYTEINTLILLAFFHQWKIYIFLFCMIMFSWVSVALHACSHIGQLQSFLSRS